ncbi:HNH endonuclease signature motif containing protein [Aliagarivorans taiwanensis]|uniref:HNH endonuclease signature motif containing protein n=1 Tax=Aliagarivorans taiwanensis TaxID=561966 RepID=UPI0004129507|nr:HNH endonuclease signature motif containing protein [Aliagarivorans taiwanensis]
MKLDVNLSQLWACVEKMGADAISFDVGEVWDDSDLEFDAQLSSSGIEISLDELESEHGLLSARGRQVILFIPDQGFSIDKAIDDPSQGRKFHIADCRTLDDMRRMNRFERYKITNNLSGQFPVYGNSKFDGFKEADIPLRVCRNCLKKLNYHGVNNASRAEVTSTVNNFNIEEFFSTYSSLFSRLPRQHVNDTNKGYTEDFKKISDRIRSDAGYICQHCKVDLTTDKHLLHTHHINGDKADNADINLVALCADCHRKEPFHGHMCIKHSDTQRINQLRNEQGVYSNCDWPTVKRKADPALHGVLDYAERKGYSAPEVAYSVNTLGEKAPVVLELAWPHRKFGVVLSNPQYIDRWQIVDISGAMKYFSRPLKGR